jgi:uncharacterized Fe-S radical SAM superfamily protein PflX
MRYSGGNRKYCRVCITLAPDSADVGNNQGLRRAGENPVFVYNTNAYDRVATLRMLEGIN